MLKKTIFITLTIFLLTITSSNAEVKKIQYGFCAS